eukprot:m.184928 g.184928  ORF g.184928 m.184928 type:complete len:1003 (-) comp15564_c1_seq1:506-3514(-)
MVAAFWSLASIVWVTVQSEDSCRLAQGHECEEALFPDIGLKAAVDNILAAGVQGTTDVLEEVPEHIDYFEFGDQSVIRLLNPLSTGSPCNELSSIQGISYLADFVDTYPSALCALDLHSWPPSFTSLAPTLTNEELANTKGHNRVNWKNSTWMVQCFIGSGCDSNTTQHLLNNNTGRSTTGFGLPQKEPIESSWSLNWRRGQNSPLKDQKESEFTRQVFAMGIGDSKICNSHSHDRYAGMVKAMCTLNKSLTFGDFSRMVSSLVSETRVGTIDEVSLNFNCRPKMHGAPEFNAAKSNSNHFMVDINHACACQNSDFSCSTRLQSLHSLNKKVRRCSKYTSDSRTLFLVYMWTLTALMILAEALRKYIGFRSKTSRWFPSYASLSKTNLGEFVSALGFVSPINLNESRETAFVSILGLVALAGPLLNEIFIVKDNAYLVAASYLIIIYPVIAGFHMTEKRAGLLFGLWACASAMVASLRIMIICTDKFFGSILFAYGLSTAALLGISCMYLYEIVKDLRAKHSQLLTFTAIFRVPSKQEQIASVWAKDDFRGYVRQLCTRLPQDHLSEEGGSQKLKSSKVFSGNTGEIFGLRTFFRVASPRVSGALVLASSAVTAMTVFAFSMGYYFFGEYIQLVYSSGNCWRGHYAYQGSWFLWNNITTTYAYQNARYFYLIDPLDCNRVALYMSHWLFALAAVASTFAYICTISQIVSIAKQYMYDQRRLSQGLMLEYDKSHLMKTSGPSALIGALKFVGFQIVFLMTSLLITAVLAFVLLITFVYIGSVLPAAGILDDWFWPGFVRYMFWDGHQPGALVVMVLAYFMLFVLAPYLFSSSRTRPTIKNRVPFDIFDLFEIFLNMMLGLLYFVGRVVMNLILGILFLPRLDKVSLPSGYDLTINLVLNATHHPTSYEKYDLAFSAYLSFLVVDRFYGNKILQTFTKLLLEDNIRNGERDIARNSRIARNRWYLAYTLLNNPALVQLRKKTKKRLAYDLDISVSTLEEPLLGN